MSSNSIENRDAQPLEKRFSDSISDKGIVEEETRPRVMVVDDDLIFRQAMFFILRNEFDVTTIESGAKAIEQLQQGIGYDVVSLDIHMPGMSGIETLKAIKKYIPDTEVLIATGSSNIETAKQALKFGAFDYINKPFDKETLRAAVRTGVGRRSKNLESKKAREQLDIVKAKLVESEKFSAIGEMLSGVMHELNNPLGAVTGYAELLLATNPTPETIRKYVITIYDSAMLCLSITRKVLDFSRKHEPKHEFIQIVDIVKNTLDLKEHDLKVNNIQLYTDFPDHMPATMADFHQLQQVFLNIITNAKHAMKGQSEPQRLTVSGEFDDQRIRIRFQDTGTGISKENIQKIFEPFFTTKGKGKGTGLGLSICYDIVKAHKGDIYISSQPGKGACFVVELPIMRTSSPA